MNIFTFCKLQNVKMFFYKLLLYISIFELICSQCQTIYCMWRRVYIIFVVRRVMHTIYTIYIYTVYIVFILYCISKNKKFFSVKYPLVSGNKLTRHEYKICKKNQREDEGGLTRWKYVFKSGFNSHIFTVL